MAVRAGQLRREFGPKCQKRMEVAMQCAMRDRWRYAAILAVAALILAIPETAAGQLGLRPAEQWIEILERPERVKGLRIEKVIDRLRLEPESVVADIGAGTGVFSLPLASALSPAGKLYAVEVDQGLVDHIAERARNAGATNLVPVLGEFGDPALPKRDLDLAFFHDVLHHVEDRLAYLKNLARYLKPDGRIAVIERTGVHRRRDQRHMQMTKDEVTGWMEDAGFEPAEEYFMFGDQKWFVVYSRL